MINLNSTAIRFFIIILIVSAANSLCQTERYSNTFIKQNFILSLESGITYGFTDYTDSHFEPLIRGSIEYYPITINNARLGLKLYGGGFKISATDNRGSISNNDEPDPREIPLDIYTEMMQAGALLNFGLAFSESFISQIGVGATYMNFNPRNDDGTKLLFNQQNKYDKDIFSFVLEGGIKYKLSDRFSLNATLAYYPTSTDYLDDVSASSSNDSYYAAMIGISFALSSEVDSDKDGVTDGYDQCPDTPAGVNVDQFGCPVDSDNDGIPDYLDKCANTPINIVVDENGCPLDVDKDGVPDYLDKCENTPLNIAVDSLGCPIDSDGDGVPDYLDKCSNTPLGTKVDSVGCPILTDTTSQQETFYQFILRGDDTFETSSAKLLEPAKIILKEVAGYIKSQTGSKWRIEGYTDNQGSVSLLKKLSYDRAKSVLDYLVNEGLSSDQFSLFGLGSSSPIANNNTPEGRSTNRRILIIKEE